MSEELQIYQYPPSKQQVEAETGKQEFETVERIVFGTAGIQMYVKGHRYPHKGLPTAEALAAVSMVKKLLKLSLVGFWTPRRTLHALTEASFSLISPFILKEIYMTPCALELQRFFTILLGDYSPTLQLHTTRAQPLPAILASIIEYDRSYRFRLQDLMAETTQNALAHRPIREIRRLLAINRERDYEGVSQKLAILGWLAFLLLVPRWKRRWRMAIQQCAWENFLPDISDCYWMQLQTDYKYAK